MILPYGATVLLVVATLYSAIVSFRQAEAGNRPWIFSEAPSRSARIVVGVLTLALLTGLAVWLAESARNSTGPASRFLVPRIIPAGYESSLRCRERRLYRWKQANMFSKSLQTECSERLPLSNADGPRITIITILLRVRAHSQIPDGLLLFGAESMGKNPGPRPSENTKSFSSEPRSSSKTKSL
jgi:hypothetical protein